MTPEFQRVIDKLRETGKAPGAVAERVLEL